MPGRSASSGEVRTGSSCVIGRPRSRAASSRASGCSGLEQLAHLVGADQAVELAADGGGLVGPRRGPGPRRARRCPGGPGTRAWVRMAASAPSALGGGHHGGEVGVDGEVGLAGAGQGIDLLVAAERLQGVAEARARRGRSRSAAPRRRRAASRAPSSAPSAAWAADCSQTAPSRASGSRRDGRRRRRGRRRARRRRPGPPPARPSRSAVRTNWRAGRQSSSSLAIRISGAPAGHLVQAARPSATPSPSRSRLQARRGAEVSTSQTSAASRKPGAWRSGAQDVAHQRPVAGAHLDQPERARAGPSAPRPRPPRRRSARRTSG